MEHSLDITALADFNLVATHGGFGRASRASGQPKATLSRRVRALEESLGVRLVERGARRLKLTPEGAILHARTVDPFGEIAQVAQELKSGIGRPRGVLRVSAPLLFALTAMGRLGAAFLSAHPEVRLEVTAEDRLVDLVGEGYDVAVRFNPRPDDALDRAVRSARRERRARARAAHRLPRHWRPAGGEGLRWLPGRS